jgi:hypothetical protein
MNIIYTFFVKVTAMIAAVFWVELGVPLALAVGAGLPMAAQYSQLEAMIIIPLILDSEQHKLIKRNNIRLQKHVLTRWPVCEGTYFECFSK